MIGRTGSVQCRGGIRASPLREPWIRYESRCAVRRCRATATVLDGRSNGGRCAAQASVSDADGAHPTLTAGFDLVGRLRAEIDPQAGPYAIACGPFPGSQSFAPRSWIQLGPGTSGPVRLSQRTYCVPMRSREQSGPYDEDGILGGCGERNQVGK